MPSYAGCTSREAAVFPRDCPAAKIDQRREVSMTQAGKIVHMPQLPVHTNTHTYTHSRRGDLGKMGNQSPCWAVTMVLVPTGTELKTGTRTRRSINCSSLEGATKGSGGWKRGSDEVAK
ncbi:hypothetical protein ZHAS_00016469 [Anopheles sinensis]|uniref:Uncharacterized protein n=1 Tax=Anopheles sinensis TaxID=74873 RepID=A0A084WE39_ANOSI|nr:hypothetical protein ZHAS_00016469 [Anopheles sinensis]